WHSTRRPAGGGSRTMVFTKRLRDGIRRGRIRCTVRIWKRLHVQVGGRYVMDDGHVIVDSIAEIAMRDITDDLARESGFSDRADLVKTATHGGGNHVYLIQFHFLAPGGWDRASAQPAPADERRTLLRRIRRSKAATSHED